MEKQRDDEITRELHELETILQSREARRAEMTQWRANLLTEEERIDAALALVDPADALDERDPDRTHVPNAVEVAQRDFDEHVERVKARKEALLKEKDERNSRSRRRRGRVPQIVFEYAAEAKARFGVQPLNDVNQAAVRDFLRRKMEANNVRTKDIALYLDQTVALSFVITEEELAARAIAWSAEATVRRKVYGELPTRQ
jgi:hypothetical protein